MKRYVNMLEGFPIAMMGTALGFLTIANAYEFKHMNFLKPIAVYFEILVAVLMLLRFIIFTKSIKNDLKNHIAASFYGTIDMGLFLVAAYFSKSFPRFASCMWICLVVLHVIFICIYSYFRIKNHKFSEIVPSWFVTYVGIGTASMTSVGMGYDSIAIIIAYFVTISYICIYPFVLYKIFTRKLSDIQITTTGIIAAPAGLALGALMSVCKDINIYLFGFLAGTLIVNLIINYYFVAKLFTRKFNPGLAAFTFPLAVSVLISYKIPIYLKHHSMEGSTFFNIMGDIELVIASLVIAYVLINLLIIFFKALVVKSKEIKKF